MGLALSCRTGEAVFEVRADFSPEYAVSVAYSEEVRVAVTAHVRVRDVVVLVHLVGVARRNALLRGKRELGHHVLDLLDLQTQRRQKRMRLSTGNDCVCYLRRAELGLLDAVSDMRKNRVLL